MEQLNEFSGRIIGAAIEVHRHLGPGLLESAYEECLNYELVKEGLSVRRQEPVPVLYKEVETRVRLSNRYSRGRSNHCRIKGGRRVASGS